LQGAPEFFAYPLYLIQLSFLLLRISQRRVLPLRTLPQKGTTISDQYVASGIERCCATRGEEDGGGRLRGWMCHGGSWVFKKKKLEWGKSFSFHFFLSGFTFTLQSMLSLQIFTSLHWFSGSTEKNIVLRG
jgi:hypothetical protein